MTLRHHLVIFLALLLLLPPVRPAEAQGGVQKVIRDEVAEQVAAQIAVLMEQWRAERAADREAWAAEREGFMSLIQLALQPRDAIEAAATEAAEALGEAAVTEAGKMARELVEAMPIDEVREIAKDTPKEVVDRLKDQLDDSARRLKALAEEKQDALAAALRDACGKDFLGKKIQIDDWSDADLKRAVGSLSSVAGLSEIEMPDGGATDAIKRLILSLSDDGRWTSHLLAWLPDDLLPACARTPTVRQAARESSEVDLTAEAVKTVLSAAMSAALASGNPYAIAIVAVLMLLASIFGGGGGKGKKGQGKGRHDPGPIGPGPGPNPDPNREPEPGPVPIPGPKPPTDPTVVLDPNGEWRILDGDWPTFEFVHRDDVDLRCKIDMTQVLRADTGTKANPVAEGAQIESVRCDPDGWHSMTVRVRLPEDAAPRPYRARFEEGVWQIEPGDDDGGN